MRRFDKEWLLSACSSGGRNPRLLFKAALARSQQASFQRVVLQQPCGLGGIRHYGHHHQAPWVFLSSRVGAQGRRSREAMELSPCRVQGTTLHPPISPSLRGLPPASSLHPPKAGRCASRCAPSSALSGRPKPPQAERKPSLAKVAAENQLSLAASGAGTHRR